MTYTYITFPTVHEALHFEEVLKGTFTFRIVPVPRELSTTCGIAVRLSPEDLELAKSKIEEHSLKYGEIHTITKS